MKKIYLIRHGESEANATMRWQGTEGGLTQRGEMQSHTLGARLAGMPFEALISSPLPRAAETTSIIAEHTAWDEEIVYSDLFVERRKPSVQIGMSRESPESLAIETEVIAHFAQPGWRYSDEENYEDMTARARQALAYLAARKENDIAVVTHGYFMRVMLACAIAGDALTPEVCSHFLGTFRTTNTGISLLLYEPERQDRQWLLWTWNDHAHLNR